MTPRTELHRLETVDMIAESLPILQGETGSTVDENGVTENGFKGLSHNHYDVWEDEEEEVVSGINYLPTTSNDSEYGYTLTGVRTKDAKGLVIKNNKVVLVK